jgi:hypothetical protein
LVAEGFVRPVHRSLAVTESDPEPLIETLGTVELAALDKWIGRREA